MTSPGGSTWLLDDQKEFYKLFWSTRVYFSDPPTIFADDNFEKLRKVIRKMLVLRILAEQVYRVRTRLSKDSKSLLRKKLKSWVHVKTKDLH
jgi:hypothetical protein